MLNKKINQKEQEPITFFDWFTINEFDTLEYKMLRKYMLMNNFLSISLTMIIVIFFVSLCFVFYSLV